MSQQTTIAENCPACGARIEGEAALCEQCGVPMGAYRQLVGIPDRLLARGTRMMQRGSHEEALEYFSAARLLSQDSVTGLKRTIVCLLNLGRVQQALEKLVLADSDDQEIQKMRESCMRELDKRESEARYREVERENERTQRISLEKKYAAACQEIAALHARLTAGPCQQSVSDIREEITGPPAPQAQNEDHAKAVTPPTHPPQQPVRIAKKKKPQPSYRRKKKK